MAEQTYNVNCVTSPHTVRLRGLLGERVRTPDGVGILLGKDTPSNGLYYEDDRSVWHVWYGTGNTEAPRWVQRTYAPEEIEAAEGTHARAHHLDVDFEVARSLHRVVRAMQDGECPKCHNLFDSRHMRSGYPSDLKCPGCGFLVTHDEAEDAIAAFAPVMEKNLEVFEAWRAGRG